MAREPATVTQLRTHAGPGSLARSDGTHRDEDDGIGHDVEPDRAGEEVRASFVLLRR